MTGGGTEGRFFEAKSRPLPRLSMGMHPRPGGTRKVAVSATIAGEIYTKVGERPGRRKVRVSPAMKKVMSISEVVASAATWQGAWELRATAEALYDEAKSVLVVQLESCARPSDAKCTGGIVADWLPGPRIKRESVPWTRALPAAETIFQHWVEKVRLAVTAPAHN
jgi:hypothetical protein